MSNVAAAATRRLRQCYISSRYLSVDEWPRYQPKHYTTLAFIHNKGKCTDAVRFSFTHKLAAAGNINPSQQYKYSENVSITKNISDIFLPIMASDGSFVDLHILIEGAPGIGKTVLAKEIAYQWAKNELLTSKKVLLLVFLRECQPSQLKSIEGFVQYVFKNDEVTPYFTKYLFQTDGNDAVIIFDGFDELSEENRKKSIVIDIINRRILAKSCVVITSRPTASSSLHESVDRRVEIVGFTEEDRLDYIQTALENCDGQVKALQYYLQSNPTINALCYIPLNMTILLCLAEDGIDRLPKTQTEMYKKFIEMTIVRFIKKKENCDSIINIAELPHPHDKVFVELAKLAYKALKTDKMVFTLSEIKGGCQKLTMTSSNWNGLGLLKAVQYFSAEIGNDQVNFHFLHFSIQEYMAAWYISTLPNNRQVKLLKKTFWEQRYYNTWIMYVGITCGSSFALRHFLSGNWFQIYSKLFKTSKVSNKYLKDKMKCLHLFQCLVEANKEDVIESVKQLFRSNQIDLSNQTLLPSDLNTLGFFLVRSLNKEWDVFNLSNCNIGSEGSHILCDRFNHDVRSLVTIKMVNFSYNQLNFSSLIRLFGLFNSWHTSEIFITDDAIFDNTTDIKAIEDVVLQSSTLTVVFIGSYLFFKNSPPSKIIHVLSSTTNIRIIYLLNCNLNYDSTTSKLLNLLKRQSLNKVRIIGPSLQKIFIKTMASILLHNNDSVNMFVYDPTMSDQIGDEIINSILSSSEDISGVMLIVSSSKVQGVVNTSTLSNELSALELFNLNIYVRYLNTKMCPWREIMENHNENITINTFYELLHKSSINCKLKIALLEGDTLIVHKTKFADLVHSVNSVSAIHLSDCDVTDYDIITKKCLTIYVFKSNQLKLARLHGEVNQLTGAAQFVATLDNITTLNIIEIDNFDITNETSDYLAHILQSNTQLQELHLNRNSLQANDTIKIARALYDTPTVSLCSDNTTDTTNNLVATHSNITCETNFEIADSVITAKTITLFNVVTLTKLSISNNNITVEAAGDIAAVISNTYHLQELNLGNNNLQTSGIIKITKAFQKISSLTKLYINDNNITHEAADDIAAAISCNIHLQELNLDNNNLQTTGVIKIIKALKDNSTLRKLYLSNVNISDEVADDIAAVISCNTQIEVLDVSGNNIKAMGAVKIAKNLCHICTPKILFICDNNIAADDVAAVISGDRCLQELYICRNSMQTSDAEAIVKALQGICTLKKLHFGDNKISDEAANDIAAVVSCNTKLNVIEISGSKLQTTGTIKIMKGLQGIYTLKKLYLNNNKFTEEAADDIATAISWNVDLQELNLGGNNLQALGTVKITRSLQKISSLTKLYINQNNITHEAADDIATAISYNNNLEELNLGSNNLQTSGTVKIARSLQKISSLTKLYINHNNVTDEAADDIAAAISCNIHLQELNLGSNYLQASGIIKIAKSLQQKILSLTKLYINHNNITYEAADDIAAVILCNIDLQELNLGSNNLQTSGTIKIARSLQRISSLRKLCINHNNITHEAADDIAAAISCNTKLQKFDISGNDLQTAGAIKIVKALKGISTLKKLYLSDNNITGTVADNIAVTISCNTQIEELDVSGNNLKAVGVIKIAKNIEHICTLKKLCVSNNNITSRAADAIAAAISSNIHLQELNIASNDFMTGGTIKIAKGLQKISTLTKLCFCCNLITDDAADDIAAVISCNTHLQELNLGSNNIQISGTIKIAKSLQKISSLTKLYINHNSITHEAADDIAAAISCNIDLQELNLGNNNLQTSGIIKIARSLQKVSSLTKLYINHNTITDEAADDIAAAISCNIDLQELNLGNNNLQTSGIIKITRSLQKISSLTKLYINHNNITHEAADDIAAAISCNIVLQELNLSSNILHTSGAIKIARSLQKISSLTKLYINHNNVTDEAADDIATAISCNPHLQDVNIDRNYFQAFGAIKIAKSLHIIFTLTKLCFRNNCITDKAADNIATAIACNIHLQELNIGVNKFCTPGAIKIAKALQKISTLTKLYIDCNNITDDAANDIGIALCRNAGLQEVAIEKNCFHKETAIQIASFARNLTIGINFFI